MIILEKNFEDKDTYIVGEYIQNGCQTFKIEDLDKICTEYEVPEDIKESVREAYYENSRTEEDYESLSNSADLYIRALVAKNGKCLDKLVKDTSDHVRMAVAIQGHGLYKLVNDPVWSIRAEVARQGYGLDKLVNDCNQRVRAEVAKQGYGLDKLANDYSWRVRYEVFKQGYGLDKVANGNGCFIRSMVSKLLNIFKEAK